MIGAQGPQTPHEEFANNLSLLTRRLRSIDLMKLSQGERISSTQATIQKLADSARAAEGLPPMPVPLVNPSALADQCEVIGRDLLTYCTDDDTLRQLSEQIKNLRLKI